MPIPAGLPELNALSDTFAVMGAAMRFEHNSEIFGEGEPAEYFYKVVRGAVRTYKLLNDGRRQISAFHLTGDIFGLEAGKDHRFTADAIADSTVLVIKRTALMALAARDSEIASGLWTQATGDLLRAQDHMLLLGRKNAHERVASFLLEMAERGARRGERRTADVAPGHCRLSRPHHRDGIAHADAARERVGHRTADLAPHPAARPGGAAPPARLRQGPRRRRRDDRARTIRLVPACKAGPAMTI